MKYRIKDPDERKAIEFLTGVSEFSIDDIRHRYWQVLNDELHYDIRGTMEVEPVKKLEDGWNPFPQTKPQKEGRYLVALKCSDNSELDFVDAATFTGNCFSAWQSDIIAWREMPKIWKDL